ncbi:MAG: CrcB family protein [Rhodococcus sp. (in: high G+C Gram-positive bacteria)]
MTTRPSGIRALHRDPGALTLVLVGGALGTAARYGCELAWPAASGQWPWATFMINVSGAFLLGVLLQGLSGAGTDTGSRRRARLLLGSGFCGAFTTYSTFSLETVNLGRSGGSAAAAVVYPLASVAAGLLAAFLGIVFGHRVSGALSGRSEGAR